VPLLLDPGDQRPDGVALGGTAGLPSSARWRL
jgi:hypothetical protein